MRSVPSGNLFALLAGALAGLPHQPEPQHKRRPARTTPRPTPTSWRFGRSPKVSRHWHNPKDPAQAACIDAAKAKRSRKATRLEQNTLEAYLWNGAHTSGVLRSGLTVVPDRLNPFHIAK